MGKTKELELQKAKLARRKKEQEEKEKATEDFIAMIDKQLEHMEANVDPITGTIPKQMKLDLEAMGEKLLKNNSRVVKPASVKQKQETFKKSTKTETEPEVAQTKTEAKEEIPPKEEPMDPEKNKSPEPIKPKNK